MSWLFLRIKRALYNNLRLEKYFIGVLIFNYQYLIMQLTFKNTSTQTKGKQCAQFLSILKKLKFLLSSKDRTLGFYVDQKKNKVIISTFPARNLENPPAGSPAFYVDYEFGEDINSISSYKLHEPLMFSFEIDDTVRLISHYYQSKMSTMRVVVDNNLSTGRVLFQVPDQAEGYVPLTIERLERFPHDKNALYKDHIDYFNLFSLNQKDLENLKQIEDVKFSCYYQINDQGINLISYTGQLITNTLLLHKDFLSDYDPIGAKRLLNGNIYLKEADRFLIEEIKIGVKKRYKSMQVNLIVIRRPENRNVIRYAYIQVQSVLTPFPKTIKRVIIGCELSMEPNTESLMAEEMEELPISGSRNNLLKREDEGMQSLRRIVINRWASHANQYYGDRNQYQKQLELHEEGEEYLEETKTKKFIYKIEDKY